MQDEVARLNRELIAVRSEANALHLDSAMRENAAADSQSAPRKPSQAIDMQKSHGIQYRKELQRLQLESDGLRQQLDEYKQKERAFEVRLRT